jgi:hypothetical protein
MVDLGRLYIDAECPTARLRVFGIASAAEHREVCERCRDAAGRAREEELPGVRADASGPRPTGEGTARGEPI